MSEDARARARRRFDAHRAALEDNALLRTLYQRWYQQVLAALPPRHRGPRLELGSGPGVARQSIDDMLLSDLVPAPWLDLTTAGESLPVRDGALGALVLFDVLHHLPQPTAFFDEATRALAPGGRIVVCDPLVSPLSYPVYRYLHEEGLDTKVDPFAQRLAADKDPFAGNQAVATTMLLRGQDTFSRRFPLLKIRSVQRFAGLSYPASGGFGRKPLLPATVWRWLDRLEGRLPEGIFRYIGFRLLAIIERV